MSAPEVLTKAGASASAAYGKFVSRRASMLPTIAAAVILILLFIGAEAFLRGDFITPRNISNLLLDNAYLVVLAVGMTFVIVTSGIDLSVGSVMAVTGITLAKFLVNDVSPWIAFPTIVAGGAAIGLLIGVLIRFFDVQPFIASLAGLFLGRGLAYAVSLNSIRVENKTLTNLQSTRWHLGDWFITPTGIIALAIVALGAVVMQFTRFGRTVYALGGSEQSARLMGLKTGRVKLLAYVISGACGGVAGLLLTAYSAQGYPRYGIGTELDVIASVVIGGTVLTGGRGFVLGSLLGVMVYGTIKTIISYQGADQAWMQIIVGALLLLFIVVQRLIVARAERRH